MTDSISLEKIEVTNVKDAYHTCPFCLGSGYIRGPNLTSNLMEVCNPCGGYGTVDWITSITKKPPKEYLITEYAKEEDLPKKRYTKVIKRT